VKRSPTRRSFLRAVGAGATALPFYGLLEDSVARAAGETIPLRFAGIYHPHGVAAELFVMQSGDTETNFNLTYSSNGGQCSLQPFDDAGTYGKSYKNKIIAIEGIDLMSNANGHSTAGTILTGSYIDGTKPKNSSLDQFLAVEKKLGAATKVTSIALGVGNDSTDAGWTLSYGPGGAALPKIIDPQKAWDTLFAGYAAMSDPNTAAAEARRKLLGKSVVDFVIGDVNRLNARLGTTEKLKLQQHLDSMSDLSKQYDATTTGSTGGGGSCSPGKRPTNPASIRQYNGGEPYFDAITDMFIDMLAQAFACDITRFATLLMNDLSYANNPLGLPADNHGSVAHTYAGSDIGSDGHPVGAGTPSTWVPLAKFNRYSYGKIARFMQKLDALGALDNTIIYASSDMGNPAQHSTRNVPTVLAGGANGKFRMGRRLKAAADCPSSNVWCAPGDGAFVGTTNNKILVAIAQAFGVTDVNSFGTQSNTAWTTGALPNLT
jgi:Protein of unknown function (DUF1552)